MIIGGNGFLGSHLANSLKKRARVVVTYHSHHVPIEGVLSLPIDIRDGASLKRIMYGQRPDAVVYLGGPEDARWVDENPKIAEKVFASGPGEILQAAEINSARFLYVSSTSVFDGTRGNYLESDNISPNTLLGKVKASGENLVRGRSNNSSILRLSPLVGSSHPWRPSFFDRLRTSLAAGKTVEIYDHELHSWLSIRDAVAGIRGLLTELTTNNPKNTLYHLGGLTRLSAYEISRMFARKFGFPENHIIVKKRAVQKGMLPLADGEKFDFSLNSSEFIRAIGVRPTAIEETLGDAFALDL